MFDLRSMMPVVGAFQAGFNIVDPERAVDVSGPTGESSERV